MRIVVTGAAGFLGSHLVDRLLGAGHEVIGIDSLLTGSKNNLSHLDDHKQFTFLEADVTKFIKVDGAVDRIFHFASPASPKYFLKYPVHILKVGALGTLNALGLAQAKGARIMLASTSEVYGDPQIHPQKEDYWGNVNPIGQRSMYDEAKRFGEALMMAYHHQNKIDTRIVRIFNTYGPRMGIDDGRALPNFLRNAIKGEPITIYGDGSQTRSFCFVDDLIEGILRLMDSDSNMPVNIGNPEEIDILQLAKDVKTITGTKSEIVHLPLPKDDPVRRRPDIQLAKNLLGWEPKVDRTDGLRRTYEDFKVRMRASS